MQGTIENYIPQGRENKISRESLKACTGLPDRSVRRLISEARMRGIAIVGDPAGGYYLAETNEDYNLLINELMSRATKLKECSMKILEGFMVRSLEKAYASTT